MRTIELGNGEKCPWCEFVTGEDYDGDGFKHIMDKHPDEAMKDLFPPMSLPEALNTMTLVCEYAVIRDEELILRKTALEPLRDVRNYLVSKYNEEVIRDNDISIKYKTPEPQGEEHEEEE